MNGVDPEVVKQETLRQWTAEPAGAVLGDEYERGTREFFDEVQRARYELYPWLLEYLHSNRWAGKDVLEIGVGLGTDHLQLARQGARLTGIDLTLASIDYTRCLLDFHGFDSQLEVADAEHLPFSEAMFDCVYSFGVLHHTPSMRQAIGEIRRVLRPGGFALVALYNRHSYFYAWRLARYSLRFDWRHSSREQMRSAFEYGEASPLVVVSSRRELYDAFRSFADVAIEARHIPRHRLPPRSRGVLEPVLRVTERRLGWYWIVEAQAAQPSGN